MKKEIFSFEDEDDHATTMRFDLKFYFRVFSKK